MRISVVIIVFNLENYVAEAIDSALRQTRRADEVIVVDDCSTDRSAERVSAYRKDTRYIRMPSNSGALRAALEGVKAASGDVICMLDGDDFWASNKLEVVEQEFLGDPDLMLLSHDHVRVDENGATLSIQDGTHKNIAAVTRRARSPAEFSELLRDTVLAQRGYWLGSAYSFRRCFFDVSKFELQIKLFELERLRQVYLDLTIAPFLVLTNPGKNVGYTANTHFFYRIHGKGSMGGGTTVDKARQSALKGRTINELIDLILRENGAPSQYLKHRKLILQEYDYLLAVYSCAFSTASRLFLLLALRLWKRDQLKKEIARFGAVFILGPQRFLTMKTKWAG
jgi:glycosyltransferase involved in cell wall biosynthesis